jgi:hypothetical protein
MVFQEYLTFVTLVVPGMIAQVKALTEENTSPLKLSSLACQNAHLAI